MFFDKPYPPVGFYFEVYVNGMKMSFSEVSGLEHEVEVQTVKGGGEHAYEIKLPGRNKYNNLVLKRGHVDMFSMNMTWLQFQTMFNVASGLLPPILPSVIMINLLDENNSILTSWTAGNAYPVKWNVSGFNAMESKVVIETVEFVHHGLLVM